MRLDNGVNMSALHCDGVVTGAAAGRADGTQRGRLWRRRGLRWLTAAVLLLVVPPARASDEPPSGEPPSDEVAAAVVPPAEEDVTTGPSALLLPTTVLAGPVTRRPPRWLRRQAAKLDGLLNDTAQDLGLLVELVGPSDGAPAYDGGLYNLARAREALVVHSALRLLETDTPTLQLRMTVARPHTRVLLTRQEETTPADLAVRTAVMLRDLVRAAAAQPQRATPAERALGGTLSEATHSRGRVILATNGALYGGFLGFSLQRAAQSDDPRLLYPLVAVGAGAGLGAAIIVSDEWDVGVGDAWYLSAGAWWPAAAGHLIYRGRFGDLPGANEHEPWAFGLVGSATGLTLSAVGLLSRGMGDGGAAMAHSGGAFGMVVGGLTEFAVNGSSVGIPFSGLGYGAGAGWLLASAAAIQFHPDAADVLAIDIGLMLGGLAGASAGSPLLFGEQTAAKTRGWVAITGAGLVGGGMVGWYLTRAAPAAPKRAAAGTAVAERLVAAERRPYIGLPMPALVGAAPGPGEITPPGMGVRWHGQLW